MLINKWWKINIYNIEILFYLKNIIDHLTKNEVKNSLELDLKLVLKIKDHLKFKGNVKRVFNKRYRIKENK